MRKASQREQKPELSFEGEQSFISQGVGGWKAETIHRECEKDEW